MGNHSETYASENQDDAERSRFDDCSQGYCGEHIYCSGESFREDTRDKLCAATEEIIINQGLGENKISAIERLLQNNYLRAKGIESKPYNYEMQIKLASDKPFHATPRRLSHYEKNELRKITDELLKITLLGQATHHMHLLLCWSGRKTVKFANASTTVH